MSNSHEKSRTATDDIARRSFLASTGVVITGSLSGCLSGSGEETTVQLREPPAPSVGIATLEDDLRDDQRALVQMARAGETATAYGYQPFDGVEYIYFDGTYYRIQTEDAGTATVDKPVVVVSQTDATAEAVPLTEYSGHVVERLAPVMDASDPGTLVLDPDMQDFDSLHPEPQYEYVTWEGTTYRLTVENRQTEQRGQHVQTISVATTTQAFKTYLREDKISDTLTPTEFSQSARDIFRAALSDEYQEEAPYSDAFETVLTAVERGLVVDATRQGIRLVVYDGTIYRAQIDSVSWE